MISNFNAATFNVTRLKLFEVLNRFDTRKLHKRMEEEPELYFSLINAFCSFSRLQLARDKFEWQKEQAEARQRDREQKQRARTPILITADTLCSVRATMRQAAVSVDAPRLQETNTETTRDLKSSPSRFGRAAFLELGTFPQPPVQRLNNSTVQRLNTIEHAPTLRLSSRRLRRITATPRPTSQFEHTTAIQDPGPRVQQLTNH